MSSPFWKPSDEQRRTLLLLEALGLIHDLGKLSDTFLQSQEPSATIKFNHNLLVDPRRIAIYGQVPADSAIGKVTQEWLNDAQNNIIDCAFDERTDLTTILDQVQFADWTGQTYTFAELIPLVAKPGLAKIPLRQWKQSLGKGMEPGLMIGTLHGIAHIEKEGNPKQHKQPYSDVFRASPFGLEERIKTGKDQKELSSALKTLPLADIEQNVLSKRREWLEQMRIGMQHGLADTRRPHNEVSLWDWGYTVATMTKAAAAYIYKKDWPANLEDLPFRTLCINLNRLESYARTDKISDLIGVRQELDEAFKKVQELLEEKYALGNCFYSDETGAYYLLADLGYDESEKAALREKIHSYFPHDLRPQVHWGEPVSAKELDQNKRSSQKLVAEPRQRAQQKPPVYADNNLYLFASEWNEKRPENAEICTVCGVRPVGYPRQGTAPNIEKNLEPWATQDKARQRNICRICLDRRGRRAKEWATGDLKNTIWTNEVADENGRLALLVGKLGLEGWLNGTLLYTIKVIRETTKTPSPARLYRIAETARAFWTGVSDSLMPDIVGQRLFRLALYPDNTPGLGDFHAYELVLPKGVLLSVVWDESKNRFITADNLEYLSGETQLKEYIRNFLKKGRTFTVEAPAGYGEKNKVLGTLTLSEDAQEIPDSTYTPVIPILAEPITFMALIPADKALLVATSIKEKYEREMGKVRNRLPLHLGVVFAHRRTPLRALLDAGRQMLNQTSNARGWKVVCSERKQVSKNDRLPDRFAPEKKGHFAEWYEVTLEKDDRRIIWYVPAVMGDGKTEDRWYPYVYLDVSSEPTDRSRRFLASNPWTKQDGWLVHVSELKVDDKVFFTPSTMDYEFLDVTSRRFEIHYDDTGRRTTRRTRPYYIEDLDRLELLWEHMKQLERAQRYKVISTIEATRDAWFGEDKEDSSLEDKVFHQFVRDTLAGAAWPKDHDWASIDAQEQEALSDAGVRGELADLAELHMEILKEKG